MPKKNVWVAGLAMPVMIAMLLLAGSPSVTASDQPSAANAEVKIDNFSFKPQELTVAAGTTVTWTNQDAIQRTRDRLSAELIGLRLFKDDLRVFFENCPEPREHYAFGAELIHGLIELFQADPQPMWLEWALALQHRQDELFWDEEGGGWFSTTGRDPSVLLRMKEDYDGAEPTASSVSVLNLLALSHLVDEGPWRDRIERTLRLFATRLDQMGRGVPLMAAALSTHLAGVQQIVIAEGEAPSTGQADDALDRAVALHYLPFAIQLRVSAEARGALAGSLPFIAAMQPVAGITAAYVCRDFSCRQPVTTVDALEQELGITA